jgi:cytochrome c peroxidase
MTAVRARGLAALLLWAVLGAVLAVPRPGAAAEAVDAAAMARIAAPPLGLPPVPVPAENAPTAEKIALGRKLFFDRRLSRNGTMSCGMCHVPEQGFTNNELATPIGVEGRSLRRNAPTVLNVAYHGRLFHDGRETMLETQVIGPLLARNEMANPSIGYVLEKLAGLPDYAGLFERAFGAGPTIGRVGQAIASWERSMLAGNSPFDRWRYGGERDALTAQQRRGYELFVGRAGCGNCHLVGEDHALFTDGSFHDTGLGYRAAQNIAGGDDPVSVEIAPGRRVTIAREVVRSVGLAPEGDLGRHEVTLDPADLWKFKTPSLRNVALTGPYMHDGSLRSLDGVVRFYNRGGVPHDGLDTLIAPLDMDADAIAALVAFLEALTSGDVPGLVLDARSAAVGN